MRARWASMLLLSCALTSACSVAPPPGWNPATITPVGAEVQKNIPVAELAQRLGQRAVLVNVAPRHAGETPRPGEVRLPLEDLRHYSPETASRLPSRDTTLLIYGDNVEEAEAALRLLQAQNYAHSYNAGTLKQVQEARALRAGGKLTSKPSTPPPAR